MSVAACADLVRQADPDRFVTGQTATPAAQAKLWPIYALNIEIARAAWASQTPLLGQMRLQWWEDGLAELTTGQAVRAHPVLAAVADVVAQTGISVEISASAVQTTFQERPRSLRRNGPIPMACPRKLVAPRRTKSSTETRAAAS